MTTEQILEVISRLPDDEKRELIERINRMAPSDADDEKWERARREMKSLSGAIDLGEQLVPAIDRAAIYEERLS